jgi:SAM-dependent methyltransferase
MARFNISVDLPENIGPQITSSFPYRIRRTFPHPHSCKAAIYRRDRRSVPLKAKGTFLDMGEMQGWTEGYVTEIGYTHGFHVELLPWEMAAALPDAPISPGQPFDYCELGFGQGFSLALMAAANPQARFWGNDFNPDHVAHVRGLADAAGLTNLTVSEKGFRDYLQDDLPSFDIIALHGVWSWVGPAARADVVRFIDARLKPGGLVYIGYNVLPGWAQYLPLRRLMLEQARRVPGDLTARIGAALDLAGRLEGQGADYFRINPTLSPRLAQLQGRPAQYLAHEYFNESWEPVYFTDIAADLAAIGVHFAGQRRASDRWEAALQAPALAATAGHEAAGDPVFLELLRDYLTNRPFRRDLFRRDGVVPAPACPQPQHWAALGHPRDLPRRATLPGGAVVEPDWALSYDILSALQPGPLALQALQAHLGDKVGEALPLLQALDLLGPALPPDGLGDRQQSCDRLNRVILERAATHDRLQALACPVTGGAVGVDRVEQLLLRALANGEEPPASAWTALEKAGHRLLRDGRLLETPKQNLMELEERWQRFRQRRLLLLQGLCAAQH